MQLPEISLFEIALMMLPIILIGGVMCYWKIETKDYWIANIRMIIQLLLIGFVLIIVFENNSIVLGFGVMSLMLLISTWISLRPLSPKSKAHYLDICFALFIACGSVLLLLMVFILDLSPWYQAKYVIPFAGMLLANTMNSISLTGERFSHELQLHEDKIKARNQAFSTAMIPQINSLLAVGLVSLPGVMTGQIISGVSPFIAARYQIIVMAAILTTSALSIMLYLLLRMRRLA